MLVLPSPPLRGEGNISNPRVLSDMGLAIQNYNYNHQEEQQEQPCPSRIRGFEMSYSSSHYSFEQYLKAQKKRNVRQIISYAKRYHQVLETGDASALVALSSGAMRRHAMEAITVYAKYSGLYEEWCQIRKRYSLHWTNGDESLQAMQRFFDEGLSFDTMLQQIKNLIDKTPVWVGKIFRFAILTGLRSSEVLESVRLLNTARDSERSYYYNPERQALEHFRFPEIFIRRTKKAFISFVTPEMLDIVKLSVYRKVTYNQIRLACRKSGINSMYMHYTRKIFASWLRHSGIQPEIIDLLQGRVSQSILTRHYLAPKPSFKEEVLQALEKLQRQL